MCDVNKQPLGTRRYLIATQDKAINPVYSRESGLETARLPNRAHLRVF